MAAIRHILATVDLSEHSPLALTRALSLATSCHARLTVVHASKSAADASHRQELRARLSDLVGNEATAVLGTRLVVLPGDPSHVIPDYVRANDIDLLVVGRHHHADFWRLLFESAGEILTRHSKCSVLAVVEPGRSVFARRRFMPKIVCAVDLTDTSGDTLALAAELAENTHTPLAVLHVIEEWNWPEIRPDVDDADTRSRDRERIAEATERLSDLVATRVPPAVDVQTHVSIGVPGLEIARTASERNALLVVVGAHERRIFGRTFLGSTARYLLDDPPCSVLLARAPNTPGRATLASEAERTAET